MKGRNTKEKVIRIFGMAVLALLVLGWQNIMTVKAGDDKEEEKSQFEQFEIEAKAALNNCVESEKYTQMRVKVTNRGEDFRGYVQFLTSVNEDGVIYQSPLSIGQGETKVVESSFRWQQMRSDFIIRITDEDENVFAKAKQKVKKIDKGAYTIGVLTDNKEGMSYLKPGELKKWELYAHTMWLKSEYIADSWEGLDVLDRIYINDFQTKNLTEKQYEALKEWVERGGDLIIGTGEHADDTLGIFRDDFLKGKIGERKKYGRVELTFEGEKVYQKKKDTEEEKDKYEIHRIEKGKGSIWVYDIDLTIIPVTP